MTNNTFRKVAGTVFAVVAVAHALRVVYGLPIMIGEWFVPMWLSWLAVVLAGWLAYSGLKK